MKTAKQSGLRKLIFTKSILLFLAIATPVYSQAVNERPLPQFLFPGFGEGIVKSQGVGPTEFRRLEIGSYVVNIDLPPDNNVETVPVNLVRINGKIQKFANERQVKKLFPEYSNQFGEYFKTNNMDFKSRKSVSGLGTYCHGLPESGKYIHVNVYCHRPYLFFQVGTFYLKST